MKRVNRIVSNQDHFERSGPRSEWKLRPRLSLIFKTYNHKATLVCEHYCPLRCNLTLNFIIVDHKWQIKMKVYYLLSWTAICRCDSKEWDTSDGSSECSGWPGLQPYQTLRIAFLLILPHFPAQRTNTVPYFSSFSVICWFASSGSYLLKIERD